MALFNFKKNEGEEAVAPKSKKTTRSPKAQPKATPKQSATPSMNVGVVAHVLRHPRITEKGTVSAGSNAYLFDVAPNATKNQIAQAVFAIYKVTPRMVRVVTIPLKRKRNARSGRVGIKSGGKKAYVYLKKGETITLA